MYSNNDHAKAAPSSNVNVFGNHPLDSESESDGGPMQMRSAVPLQLTADDPDPPVSGNTENIESAEIGPGDASSTNDAASQGSGDEPIQAKLAGGPLHLQGSDAPAQLQRSNAPAQLEQFNAPFQLQTSNGPLQLQESPKVPFQITFKGTVSAQELQQIAMKQVFGGIIENIKWTNFKPKYDASESPVTITFSMDLLKKHRSAVNSGKGIDTDESGGVKGADARKKEFKKSASGSEKGAIYQEIDRRFFEATGDKSGTKITKSAKDKGKRELWLQIQDEVLFQHEYIKNLPPHVKKFIRYSTNGRVLTPDDYEKLFRIAKMIEKLPADLSQDYLSKVNAATTDLDKFEESLHNHIVSKAEEKILSEDTMVNKMKLAGLEEIYKKYRLYLTLIGTPSTPMGGMSGLYTARRASKLRTEIDTALKTQHNFSGIAEFESWIKKYEQSFEKMSQAIALNTLDKMGGTLYKEQQRYNDQAELTALHNLIQAGKSKKDLAQSYAIFHDDGLPADKQIDINALKVITDPKTLGAVLLGKVAERKADLDKARGHIAKDSNVIYRLDKMMPQFFLQQNIQKDSIHQMIVEDKIKSDFIKKLVIGITAAIVAIALAVVSLGTAVPAIVAAGAAAAGFGMSAVLAYDEYKNYVIGNNLANVGMADDPSIVWLIVAVVGAALDLGAAVKAISAIGKAAKGVKTAKDLAAFEKVLQQAEAMGQIDSKISKAVILAAKARVGFDAAQDGLSTILANGKGLKNFMDPDVYGALVKMAKFKAQQGVADFSIYLLDLQKMRKVAKLGDLTPEELVQVKKAWAEGRALASVTDDALKGADALVKPVKASVMKRIAGDAKFAFTHTDDELRAFIAKAKEAGLTQKDIEHLVFTSCRKDKPLNSIQLMDQVDFYKYLKQRGFPAKFKNMDDFKQFTSYLKDEFRGIGVAADDVRIQGSAVRSPKAGDIDAAAMISQSDFNNLIRRIYATKLKEGGVALDISKFTDDELLKLAQRIEANPKNFNGVARGDFHFNFTNKILQPVPRKKAVIQALKLDEVLAKLQKQFPHLNIDNFTIQVRGGKYDSHPFWKL